MGQENSSVLKKVQIYVNKL